jgi:5'-3' exonuclease
VENELSKTIIIDGNSVGHAAHRGTKLRSGDLETQAIYGTIHTARDIRRTHPGATLLWLWDGRAQWRFDMHPPYKSNRDNDAKKKAERESYKQQRPYISRALEHLGIRQVTAMKHEADDMAGYFVAELTKKPENEILLITGDEDWAQLVRRNVTWQDHRDQDKRITLSNFMDMTGFPTPYAFLEGKALQGDTSDVIGGVGGIGEGGAPEFIAEFGSVREFWRRCESGEYVPKSKALRSLYCGRSEFTKDEWKARFLAPPGADAKAADKALKKHMDAYPGQGRLIFPRNLRLMQLLKVEKPQKEDMRVVMGKFDLEKFTAVCEELAFRSITKDANAWARAFNPSL